MNTETIIAELEAERSRVEAAIGVLRDSQRGKRGRRRGRLSAAARKRISEGMKKRWAARKRKSAA